MHRIYILILVVFLTLFSKPVTTWHHHITTSSTGTWLAEKFVTDLPSMGIVVLWQTEVSSSTASGSPNPPEFRELRKSMVSSTFLRISSSVQQAVGVQFPEQHTARA